MRGIEIEVNTYRREREREDWRCNGFMILKMCMVADSLSCSSEMKKGEWQKEREETNLDMLNNDSCSPDVTIMQHICVQLLQEVNST